MQRRLTQLSLQHRAIQLSNALLTPLLCGPFGLVHLVEYPKCGGSWIRNMLADYLGVERFLADRLLRPRDVVQVHRLHRRSYRKPLVVVRDPRDLFVSFYYHENREIEAGVDHAISRHYRRDPERSLAEDFSEYLECKLRHRTHPRFSFTEFVQSWVGQPRSCVVRYEDCLENASGELIRMARFAGAPVELERIRDVVDRNSFEKETASRYGQARKPGEADPTKFQRKGIAGDWRNHFDERACRNLELFEGWTLRVLGYENDAGWIDRYLERSD